MIDCGHVPPKSRERKSIDVRAEAKRARLVRIAAAVDARRFAEKVLQRAAKAQKESK